VRVKRFEGVRLPYLQKLCQAALTFARVKQAAQAANVRYFFKSFSYFGAVLIETSQDVKTPRIDGGSSDRTPRSSRSGRHQRSLLPQGSLADALPFFTLEPVSARFTELPAS
jgi:hypothetical protein